MSSSFGIWSTFNFALRIFQERVVIASILFRRLISLVTLWFLFLTFLASGLDARVLPEIHWNSSNPIFRIDNTEHVFVVRIHDRVDFVCPFYSNAPTEDQMDVEVMEIHSVSKWAYDYCALSSDSVVAGVCNNPFQRTYATVVFREYTPKPGGLEFKPGRSYYFISTSTGQSGGLQNKQGGLCSSKHMKVKFEIEPQDVPDSTSTKSGNGYAAAGSALDSTKLPIKIVDDDTYDGQYQVVESNGGAVDPIGGGFVSGSSRSHDNSRELKRQNFSTARYVIGDLEVTTPRLYEIHTRPQDELINIKKTGHKERYGVKSEDANAQQRRNGSWVIRYSWRTLLLLLLNVQYFIMLINNIYVIW